MRANEILTEAFNHPSDLVKSILKVVPEALEIWFHGSRAIGKHRTNSDTDILVIVPKSVYGSRYLEVVKSLQKLAQQYKGYDIQPAGVDQNIHKIAKEEGELLYKVARR